MEVNDLIEVDFVINMHQLIENNDIEYVKNEILELTNYIRSFQNDCRWIIVKAILETSYLSNELIIELTKWCCHVGVDFVKTSTGYGTRGVNNNDLELIKENISNDVQIKASGGIKSFDSAIKCIKLGATRIGTSASSDLLKEATDSKLKEYNLTKKDFANMLDHTNLSPDANKDQIKASSDEAIKLGCKSICVRPEFTEIAYNATLNSNVKTCVAIGFKNLVEKDLNDNLNKNRYNISIEDKKAELDNVFSIIKIE